MKLKRASDVGIAEDIFRLGNVAHFGFIRETI